MRKSVNRNAQRLNSGAARFCAVPCNDGLGGSINEERFIMARKRQYWAFVWTHFNDGKYIPPLQGAVGPTRADVKDAIVNYFSEPWESIKKRGGSVIKCTVTPNVKWTSYLTQNIASSGCLFVYKTS